MKTKERSAVFSHIFGREKLVVETCKRRIERKRLRTPVLKRVTLIDICLGIMRPRKFTEKYCILMLSLVKHF